MHDLSRRGFGRLLAAASTAMLPAGRALADTWPSRRLTFVNGAPAGSTVDFVTRVVAGELESRLGQGVIVENRPGASFNIATQGMLRAPADGYTLGLAPITMSTNPALMDVGYDPLADITMVTQISALPVIVVVGAHRPWRSLAEMITEAKANPDTVTLGHGGNGTSGFLAAQLFARTAGVSFRMVPYRGTAPVLNDMLGGRVDGTFTPIDPTIKGHVASGAMRVLAVMQGERIAMLPDVPTTREQGFGPEVDFRSWHGLMLRAGTPPAIVQRLFDEVTAAVRKPEVARRLLDAGVEPQPSASPAEFDAFYRRELARMTALIRALGVKAEP